MVVGLNHELVAGRRGAATQGERYARRSGVAARHGARRHRLAVGSDRRGIQVEIGGAGELEDRPARREGVGVIRRVGHAGTGDDRGRRVTGAARRVEGVRRGRQIEAVTSDHRIRVGISGFEVDVQLQVDTTETDRLVGTVGVADDTVLAGFGGHVIAQRVGDLQLGAAEEADGVGLAARELRVVGGAGADRTVGQHHATVIHRRSGHGGLGATGIDGLLERIPASGVGPDRHAIANAKVDGGLVTVVAVGAVRVLRVRRGVGFRTGEQVVAVGILGVHQAQHLLLDLAQLRRIGLAVRVGGNAVAGGEGQFLGALQSGTDGVERRFLQAQRTLGGVDVGAVLTKHRALLTQLQQTTGTDRIIGGSVDADLAADFVAGRDGLVEVALVVGSGDFVILGGGNAHELRLLKGC
ncbi:hypothetical protein D3C86_939580 [compost metagenome]